MEAADGDVVVELVVEPEQIEAGESVGFWIRNAGSAGVTTGREFRLERWGDGEWEWVPLQFGFTDEGWPVAPGEESQVQRWPQKAPAGEPEQSTDPGQYRLTKELIYRPASEGNDVDESEDVVVRARFEVVGAE